MNLKKSGEKITYDDIIYFENIKFSTNIIIKNLPISIWY
jgi:hypothetical protein